MGETVEALDLDEGGGGGRRSGYLMVLGVVLLVSGGSDEGGRVLFGFGEHCCGGGKQLVGIGWLINCL